MTLSREQQKATEANSYRQIEEVRSLLQARIGELKERIEFETKKRMHREGDFTVERVKTEAQIGKFKLELDNVYNKIAIMVQTLPLFTELLNI